MRENIRESETVEGKERKRSQREREKKSRDVTITIAKYRISRLQVAHLPTLITLKKNSINVEQSTQTDYSATLSQHRLFFTGD